MGMFCLVVYLYADQCCSMAFRNAVLLAWERSKALENLFERRGLGSCTFVVTSRPCPRAYDLVLARIMYELEVCSDGTTEAQPRSFRQNRPTASTLSDIMQVQRMSRKIRENAETFPYLAKL